MVSHPYLESDRLMLRRFTRHDWKDLHEYLSDANNLEFEPYDPLSEQQVKHEAKRREGDDSYIAVCLKDGSKMIGNLYFKRGEFDTCELGYIFNPKWQGSGFATESALALLNHSFTQGDVRRVVAHCSTRNERSWKLLERLGMRREGLLIENIFFKRDPIGNPIWFDTYEYGILRREWPPSVSHASNQP